MLHDPESLGRRQRGPPAAPGVQGVGDHERRVRLVDRPPRPGSRACRDAAASSPDRERRRGAGERRLRGRLCRRSGRGRGERRACRGASGIAGLSIEDSTRDADEPLYPFDLAVERVRAARWAIDESGTGIVLTGRSEGFVVGRPDLDETIRRLEAYAEAGADCLYAPFIDTAEQVSAIVAAVAPKPLNLLVHKPFITLAEAAALGVRRISVGGTLARVAQAAFMAAAQEIADDGTFTRFAELPNNAAVNAAFAR